MKTINLTSKKKSYIISGAKLPSISSRSLGREIFCSMLLNGSSIAQIDPKTNEYDTYSNLLLKCIRTSLNLLSKGIKKDDIICQCSGSHLHSSIPIISAFFLGCKVVSLDPSRSFNEIKHLVNQVQTKIIFASPEVVDLLEKAIAELNIPREIVVFGETEKHTPFDSFLTPVKDENDFQPTENSDLEGTALILFRYKYGILHPDRIYLSFYVLKLQIINYVECWNFGKRLYFCNYAKEKRDNGFMVVMGFSTFCWISAIMMLLCSILTGVTRIIPPDFNVVDIWKNIDKYQISFMLCNTFQANELTRNEQPEQTEGTSLKMLVAAGASLSSGSLRILHKLFPVCFITSIYEVPEIGGAICLYKFSKASDIKDQYEKATSCGKLLPGINLKIIDPVKNDILKENEPGELRFKAVCLNSENRKFFKLDNEGFVRSGILGFYDESGSIHILDPYQDIIKYKCRRIVPSVLENIIREHPAVKEAIVVGVNDEKKDIGKHAVAIISLRKHMSNRVTEKDVLTFTNSFMKPKLLKNVTIVKSILPSRSGIFYREEARQQLS